MEFFRCPENNQRIIFVGEGNFSFSRCLVESWKNDMVEVYTTCYEPELNEVAQENVKHLRKFANVFVKSNFDATKMDPEELGHFHLVIFMFPHVGGKMKIDKNRDLLKKFAQSASKILKENGKILVTLCNGQGGTPFDEVQRLEADSWQIVKMMSYGQLGLIKVDKFQLENFPNYKSYGYRSQEKSFNTKEGTIHVFEKNPETLLYPQMYKHDLSFWILKDIEIDLGDLIKDVSDNIVIKVEEIDNFYNQEKNLKSKTLRLTYLSPVKVLNPEEIMTLHYKIGHLLKDKINIKVR